MDSYREQERKGFLAYIHENWDDEYSRLVYADWLEEQGEDGEAARQRKWKESKDWLVGFAKQWNFFDCDGTYGNIIYHDEFDYEDERRVEEVPGKVLPDREIIERFIEECRERPGEDWYYLTAAGIDLHGKGELGGDDKLFWEHLEIVTGMTFREAHRENFGWSCSC